MAAPNNPISGLLDPLSDYADQQTKMDQARRMLMGKYMLDQNTASATRRFETLNANIKGFEDRRKDLETHKWNMLNALIDPQGEAFQGHQRSSILKQLGFDENTYQVMLGSLNTDLRAIDRVLQSNYKLRNEAYGFGRNQGVYNTYAGGGGAGGGATGTPTGEELLIQSFQQGGAPAAVTKSADATGQEQGGQGWMADVGEMAQLTGGSIRDLAVGYWKFANDPNNWVNKLYEEGYLNPTDKKNWANQVYEKTLKLLPGDATPEQIQQFWLAPGLHERLVEIIKAGESDKKSLDLWITENIVEDFDPYFKKFGLVLDDFGITDAAKKAVGVGGQLLDDARRYWFPSDAEIGAPEAASPPAAAPPAETPSAIVPPTPSSASPDLPYHPMVSPPSQAPSPIPSGNLSGVPSPDYFGTGLVPQTPSGVTGETPSGFPGQSTLPPAQDRMAQWQKFVTDMGLPWNPLAVPTGVENTFSDRGIYAYQRNLQNLFYEGSQMGGAINAAPADTNLPYSAPPAEISVVPTYEVFQQRIQGTPGDPGFYGAPVATGTSTDIVPAATQQQVSVAQGTPGDPNLQGNVGLDTSVTSPLFQDPMGGGVGQPTMNQQTVPMAPMGGTEGVMSAVEEGAMNPFIAPGQPQGRVGPPRDPYVPPSLDGRVPPASYPSRGFGDADMDTWYQPATGIGGPSLDSFTSEDDIQDPRAFGGIDLSGPVRPYEDRVRNVVSIIVEDPARFVGDSWDDFTTSIENAITPDFVPQSVRPSAEIVAGTGALISYLIAKRERSIAFNSYEPILKDRTGHTFKSLSDEAGFLAQKEKDGTITTQEKKELKKLRGDLRAAKTKAWKKQLLKRGVQGSIGAVAIMGSMWALEEAIGAERSDAIINSALEGNKKAQFALAAAMNASPLAPLIAVAESASEEGITTLRKERHSGPETHKAPGMLGAPGGMILNYPESAFPTSGLNSGAPQVQAIMSELEKKNQ